MSRHRARYTKIERLIDILLSDLSGNPLPINLEILLVQYGIELRKGDLGEVSGLLIRNRNEIIIGVNSKHHRTRRRFTIAHELGHFLLHEGISQHVDRHYRVNFRSIESSLATNIEEIEANFFAASLLMPRHFLQRDNAIEAIDSDDAVADLARRYDVSRHAMSLRLVNLYEQHSPY